MSHVTESSVGAELPKALSPPVWALHMPRGDALKQSARHDRSDQVQGLPPQEQLVGLTNSRAIASRAHVRAGVTTPATRPPRTASPDAPSCSSAWKRPLWRPARMQLSSSTAAARRPLCIGMLLVQWLKFKK